MADAIRTLFLASGSPRRAALLQQIGVSFVVLPAPDIDETPRLAEHPEHYVRRMAQEKADAGLQSLSADQRAYAVVLGADTSVVVDGDILGKPAADAQAVAMLGRLSGRAHQVISAVALTGVEGHPTIVSVTDVRFCTLTLDEIRRYVATGEPADKAGSYGIQGFGATLVESIQGSYSGVVGLPLTETAELLILAGIPCWRADAVMTRVLT